MYNKPSDRYAADRTADDIQGQNDEALEGLSQKVKLLKNVSLSLSLSREDMALAGRNPDSENLRARTDHDQYRQRGPRFNKDDERHGESPPRVPEISVRLRPCLELMPGGAAFSQNDTFGTTGAFLSGTMTKMKKMARRQGGQWCLCACPPSPFYFLPSVLPSFAAR